MQKPFYSMGGVHLISDSAKKRLISNVLRHPEKLYDNTSSVTKKFDGITSASAMLASIWPDAIALRKRIRILSEVSVVYIRQHTATDRHTDARAIRQCSIMMGLHPLDEYAPTHFWEDMESKTPSYSLQLHEHPALVNLRQLHSVDNTSSSPRFSLQISFELPFEKVLQLHLDGRLFHPAPAST